MIVQRCWVLTDSLLWVVPGCRSPPGLADGRIRIRQRRRPTRWRIPHRAIAGRLLVVPRCVQFGAHPGIRHDLRGVGRL